MQTTATQLAPRQSLLKVGDQLGDYRLTDFISESSACAVFKAWDVASGRAVVIKAPHIDAESDIVLFERFKREALIVQELNHPVLSKVLHKENDPHAYLVLEWAEGQSLRHLLTAPRQNSP